MSELPTPQRLSLVDQTIEAVLALIVDRGLKADDFLPSTAELAETLQVSRPVVREAIAELAGQGLLRRRQGRETLIALPSGAQFEKLLRLRSALREMDLDDLQEYREIIEVAAARLAALRSTAADVEALAEIHRAMVAADHEDERHRVDQQFHTEIARIAGNEMLRLTLEGITPVMLDLRKRAWAGWAASGGGVEPVVAAHAQVLEAIRERDADAAGTAMVTHLAQARQGLAMSAAADHRPNRPAAAGG
ncbi:MAG: FCD domain-containing protein [Actinobacteria bacterium]|nr:FCD domain-containing protein [Actinomycetota bacterium]